MSYQSTFKEYIKPELEQLEKKEIKIEPNITNDTEIDIKKPIMEKDGIAYKPRKPKYEKYYWLDIPRPKPFETRTLAYSFDSLVKDVRHMKLPNLEWKIKIMVHKQEIVSVSIMKKGDIERSVNVFSKNLTFELVIGSRKVLLLGSPVTINSIKDLEVLLDILNEIPSDSSLLCTVGTVQKKILAN